ncbi:jg23994 [Pararge aegeria aegeria]|uniref:Jg23994 protein n=1 Tax=Pararge aegeria aegeria TaxID=348720 RepID=A0A8S4SQE8_9NEOP|nr:jg23994 [Pararge aegeria aegeria]
MATRTFKRSVSRPQRGGLTQKSLSLGVAEYKQPRTKGFGIPYKSSLSSSRMMMYDYYDAAAAAAAAADADDDDDNAAISFLKHFIIIHFRPLFSC